MLTIGRAKFLASKLNLATWCKENDLDYSRMSKILTKHPLYPPRPEEIEILGRWLGVPSSHLLADAWPIVQAFLDQLEVAQPALEIPGTTLRLPVVGVVHADGPLKKSSAPRGRKPKKPKKKKAT